AGTETAEGQRLGGMTTWNANGQFRATYAQTGDILMDSIAITGNAVPNVATYAQYLKTAALNKSGAGTLTLVGCRIAENFGAAGSIKEGVGCSFAAGSTVIMERCVIEDNTVTGYQPRGAGIYSEADLTLIDCVIARNRGSDPANAHWETRVAQGLGLAARGGSLTMIRTEVLDNEGGGSQNPEGGGIGVHVAEAVSRAAFTNCLFRGNILHYGNVTYAGGGMGAALHVTFLNDTVPVDIINCTFTGNRSDGHNSRGGALYASGGIVTIKNGIFWANEVTGANPIADGHDLYIEGTGAIDLSYSCIDTEGTMGGYAYTAIAPGVAATLGDGLFAADPLFVGATDNHLQSREGAWDRATQTWRKSPANSPCISMGDPADDHALEPQPSGKAINLGAYGNTPEASKTQAFGTIILLR
ncbi:MAG: right-handed parallel beta-helix repeat-containing protein, partial [Kiritimatiellaeota bacterium]|nr:right-handed parallel beta-helix repeat-containing protein [Kiritimatiellota bacterium]